MRVCQNDAPSSGAINNSGHRRVGALNIIESKTAFHLTEVESYFKASVYKHLFYVFCFLIDIITILSVD